jgi:hypothetical protein
MSDLSPNEILLGLIVGQPHTVRRELMHQIVIHLGDMVQADDVRVSPMALEFILPREWPIRFRNAILIAGLLDHIMNTLPLTSVQEHIGGKDKVTSLTRITFFAARERWRQLRASELSPAVLADIRNYCNPA